MKAGYGGDWQPAVRPDVVFRRVGEDWLLFDPDSQQVHVLNLAAALVWSSCTGEKNVATIVGEVGDAYEGEDVESDVRDILERFYAAGLLLAGS